MQRRSRYYGSSGELGVFGATRYFDGLADLAASGELGVFGATRYFDGLADLAANPVTVKQPEDVTIQPKDMHHKEETCRRAEEQGAKTKSNLAAVIGCLASLAASFRKNPPGSSSAMPGIHDEPPQVSSSSSRGSSDVATAAPAAAFGRDFGEVVWDRRLQGVRVVRGAGGDDERWVVRCGAYALEEERHVVVHEKIVDAKLSEGHQVEKTEDGDGRGWDSVTSSDLFELDLDDTKYQ